MSQFERRRLSEFQELDEMFSELLREVWTLGSLRMVREQPFLALTDPVLIGNFAMVRYGAARVGTMEDRRRRLSSADTLEAATKILNADREVKVGLAWEFEKLFRPATLKRLRPLMASSAQRPAWKAALQTAIISGGDYYEIVGFARSIGIQDRFEVH
jgi:hypothetical protein